MRALWMLGVAIAVGVAASPVAAQQPATQQTTKTTTTTTKTTTTRHARRTRSRMSSEQMRLRREAKISERTARETALKEAPGRVHSTEIERENGKLIWSFDIAQRGKAGYEEVNVDAMDGSIVSHTHESMAHERRERGESKAESKESKEESKEQTTTTTTTTTKP